MFPFRISVQAVILPLIQNSISRNFVFLSLRLSRENAIETPVIQVCNLYFITLLISIEKSVKFHKLLKQDEDLW